jgi:xanthosine utilization system XapX-like protein
MDANQASSIISIDTASALTAAKIKETAKDSNLSRLFILGLAVGVGSLIVLVYLGLTKLSFIPISIISGCLVGVMFLRMEVQYPKALPIIGIVVVIGSVGSAVVYYLKNGIFKTAAVDMFNNIQNIKAGMVEEPNRTALQTILQKQADSTKRLVARMKGKKC